MTVQSVLLPCWLAGMAASRPTNDEPDEALVAAWVETGDEGACRFLVTRYRRRVIHVAAGVLGPRFAADAEDVAQEAFARAFERLHTLRDRAQFASWVARIAFHLAIERRRLSRLRRPHIQADESLRTADTDGDLLVRRAVEELPPVPRSVLHLHYWLGYTVEEIGQLLHMPANTVKSHLARGRQRIAHRVEGVK